jgi:hypothetical protein
MTIQQVIRASGAFRAELKPGALKLYKKPEDVDPSLIITAEIIPWSQDPSCVHIVALTFREKRRTTRPVYRRVAADALGVLGRFNDEILDWKPAIILARPKRRRKTDPWQKAYADSYTGSELAK